MTFPLLLVARCAWCQSQCLDLEAARECACPNHQGEVASYCSKSCKVADHG